MNICKICNKRFTKNGIANNEITICNKCIEKITIEVVNEFIDKNGKLKEVK